MRLLLPLSLAAAFMLAPVASATAQTQTPTPAPLPGTPAASGAVAPQLRVPLGRTPPAPGPAASGGDAPSTAASAPGGIDDRVAQCKAQTTRVARQECMDRAGRASRPR